MSNFNLKLTKKRLARVFVGTLIILAVPLIAMQFSQEVSWTLADFVAIGTLLLVAGLSFEVLASNLKEPRKKVLAGLAVALVVAYIWAELAVGIFTNLGS